MTHNPRSNDTPPRGIVMTDQLFAELLAELDRRGAGCRESGAFLLAERLPDRNAPAPDAPVPIVAVAYYDDLDPNCLTGGITFSAQGYTALNARCRRDGLRVAGDIHTHPRTRVAQSHLDASHPMAALDGHVALISPNYARGQIAVEDLGAHIFRPGGWTSYFGDDVATVLTLTRTTRRVSWTARLRGLAVRLRDALSRRRMP